MKHFKQNPAVFERWTISPKVSAIMFNLWTTISKIWATVSKLWATVSKLWTTISKIWATVSKLWATVSKLWTTLFNHFEFAKIPYCPYSNCPFI